MTKLKTLFINLNHNNFNYDNIDFVVNIWLQNLSTHNATVSLINDDGLPTKNEGKPHN